MMMQLVRLAKVKSLMGAIGFMLCMANGPVVPQTLPLPQSLTPLTSPQGERFLRESQAQEDFIPLSSQFVTQENQAFCGIATSVMVLNALGVPAPFAREWKRNYFTQENVFNAQTEAVIPRQQIERQGLTLAQLAAIIGSYSVNAEVRHGADLSLNTFRAIASQNLKRVGNFVVVNYSRRAIGQEGGGHISPLAAYNAATDRFLILDVSRYKYPSVWVKAKDLWEAIRTIDPVSQKTRGIVLISELVRR
jgi:Phytochelatin synthase